MAARSRSTTTGSTRPGRRSSRCSPRSSGVPGWTRSTCCAAWSRSGTRLGPLRRGDGVRRPRGPDRRGVRPRAAHRLVHHRGGRAGRRRPGPGPRPSPSAAWPRRRRRGDTRYLQRHLLVLGQALLRSGDAQAARAALERIRGDRGHPGDRRPDRQPVARRAGLQPGRARRPGRGRGRARRGAPARCDGRLGTDGVQRPARPGGGRAARGARRRRGRADPARPGREGRAATSACGSTWAGRC